LYDNVYQLMPSGAKGRYAYQGSLAVPTIKSRDVGHTGGEPSGGEPSGTLQSDIVTGEIGDAITSGNPSSDNGDDIYGPPTSPPPTPSPSKRRFSALESVDSSSQSIEASGSLSAPSGMSARSAPLSAKRGKMTGAVALSTIGHQMSHLNDLLFQEMELNRTQAKGRDDWRRQEAEQRRQEAEQRRKEHLERADERLKREDLERERLERERLERERLERERLERASEHPMGEQDPMLRALIHMQDVDADLSPEDQATLAELFNKDHDSAKTYLALKGPVRKAWIKLKLAHGSG
jgi:hypothetical protein